MFLEFKAFAASAVCSATDFVVDQSSRPHFGVKGQPLMPEKQTHGMQ
jgi:hypothetical protein